MKEYKKPLVEVVEIETEDVITESAGTFTMNVAGVGDVIVDYHSDIFGE